jgi:hypothetical protein
MPERIQRKRTKGWKLPEGAVIVDRTSKKWGNPFKVGDRITDPVFSHVMAGGAPLARGGTVADRAHAVELYAFWVMAKVPFTQADARRELAGKDLACWCPLPADGEPDVCHARLLLDIANGEDHD